jgi:asparagine synthase (glutamine-hydrolysing)
MPASSNEPGTPLIPGAAAAGWYVPTPFEVASGWLHGRVVDDRVLGDLPVESPAAALRDVLREEVVRGNCVVPFSGGRDSSLVLAVACSIAREAGVPLPTAVTFRHSDFPESDETAWQAMVIGHLQDQGLRPEWRVWEIADELDIVGPHMAALLEEHRHSVWPPNLAATLAVSTAYPGTTILSGEYGDVVLGVRRATVIAGALRKRGRGLSATYWRAVGAALSPRLAAAGGTGLSGWIPPWLTRGGRMRWRRLSAVDALHEPLRYDRSVRSVLSWRASRVGTSNAAHVAARQGCRSIAALAHPRVLSALALDGGWRGPQSRGYATRLLGGDLLPDELYARDTKADFLASRFNRHTVATVDAWSGDGAGMDWVDAARLKLAWTARRWHPQMAGLVQTAWLDQHGLL